MEVGPRGLRVLRVSPGWTETEAAVALAFAPASQFVIDKTADGFGFVSFEKFKSGLRS